MDDEKPPEVEGGRDTGSPVATKGRWVKGQSGNSAGRPAGSRNRASVVLASLVEGELEELTRKSIELAKAGDLGALKFLLSRVVPPCRERTVELELPKPTSIGAVLQAVAGVFAAVAQGQLALEDGECLIRMLSAQSQILLRWEKT